MLIMDEVTTEVVEKTFRVVYDLKSESKMANSTATEKLNELANVLSPDKSKYGIKRYKKIVKKSFKEWVDRTMGDRTSDDAIAIADKIVGGEDNE